MATHERRQQGWSNRLDRMPWWLPLMMLVLFYLLGWVLHLTGITSGN
ncbi:hypothetical protein [Hymenobacter sp. B81]